MKHSFYGFSQIVTKSKKKSPLSFASLISENRLSEFVQRHELELAGVQNMIDGLTYHYKNFKKAEDKARVIMESIFTHKIATQGEF